MNPPHYVLLSEATSVDDFVDDAMFTDVTKDGEIYTTYRIVRFTHEVQEHHEGWTHLANVTLVHSEGIAVAFLRVRNRIIEDSRIRTHSGDTGAS
jgi:hypothetical protein